MPDKITLSNLFDRDTISHLRIPFSFYLMPVFWLGISQATTINIADTVIVFLAMHLFIYPASNVYNSYMDRDTGSIGGLEKPPPVTRRLYYASILFDIAGLLLCLVAGWRNTLLMAIYMPFSRAYSWHGIRLKKYTYISWLVVMFFQGGFTFMLANMAAQQQADYSWFTAKNLECMLFASLIIGGSYPLTQIYQHDEDSTRGDHTLSYRLGITGTFVFTALFFAAGGFVLLHCFTTWYSIGQFYVFSVALAPVIIYFSLWSLKTIRDKTQANYHNTMLMNRISSVCMTICFLIILYLNHKR